MARHAASGQPSRRSAEPGRRRVRRRFGRVVPVAAVVTALSVGGSWVALNYDEDLVLSDGAPVAGATASARPQEPVADRTIPDDERSQQTSPADEPSAKSRPEPKRDNRGNKPQKVVKTQQRIVYDEELVAAAEEAALLRNPAGFTVATFNALGASHTAPGGNRKGFASGGARMAMGVNYLRSRGVDVVGFQEFEDPQYATFAGMTGGEFAVYPGRALGPKSIRFSIAWRLGTFSLVEASSVAVPYAGGSYIQMPYVLLRHNASGRQMYFANFHNPADTPNLGNNGRWRAVATGIQIGLVNRLRSETGLPVVITGDMNEREGYFCPMTAQTDMQAANGGSTGTACAPPPAMQVDWIFGSSDISWSGYLANRGAPIPRITDHAIVTAEAYLAPATR